MRGAHIQLSVYILGYKEVIKYGYFNGGIHSKRFSHLMVTLPKAVYIIHGFKVICRKPSHEVCRSIKIYWY